MELQFADRSYGRLETDPRYTLGFPEAVVSVYRKHLQLLRAARDAQDLIAMRCLKFSPHKKKNPNPQHSIHLGDQHLLIVELRGEASESAIWIVDIRASTVHTEAGQPA